MKVCPKCSAENEPSASVCVGCGHPLGANPARAVIAPLGANTLTHTTQLPTNASTGDATQSDSSIPGRMIDRYKLLEQVGEGGFGSVWMAEQSEPVKRRVALKILKLGMDTCQIVARFEAERQALALMDHPNIAKVLDAGATEFGRPYFVMELVKGIKITQYCDQNKVALSERLSLFLQMCNAIQHAHQKGIIHRDIKPSNVLVTMQDGASAPKVIDFGIAKATEQPLTDRTLFTAYEQFLGTPAYMSPEQAERSGLDIDTRSDIYSLGVLLYELLTGRTPFDSKTLLEHGVEEARRLIREVDPPRPSTRLSTLAEGELSAVAQRRSVEARKLPKLLHGDLDWIVMKCLEKDRTRRYATVNALAMDIQRYLNHETVLARPPSQAYRFSKLVRRNKLAFVALAAGLGFASWSLIRERAARAEANTRRKEAETERAAAEQARRLAEEQRRLAENQRATAELRLYVADMNLGFQALEEGNFSRARQLLAAHATHQPDPRGFEWRYLWTHTRGQHEREFRGHGDVIRQINWAPDGRSLASRSLDDVVKVWGLASGNPTLTLTNIDRLAGYTPDGTQLILGTTNAVVSWSFQKGEFQTLFLAPTALLSILSDGQTIATSQTNFAVRLWDAASGQNKMELSGDGGWLDSDQQIPLVAVSSAGNRLAISYRQADDSWATAEVVIFDLETRREILRFPEQRPILAMEFTHDGSLLAVGGVGGVLRLCESRPNSVPRVIHAHDVTIRSLAFSPDGRILASGSSDQTIKLWDAASGELRHTLQGHEHSVSALAFSPDGKYLASGGFDQVLKIWDLDRLAKSKLDSIKTLASPTSINAFIPTFISPDSALLALRPSTNQVQIWKLDDLQEIASLRTSQIPLGFDAESKRLFLYEAGSLSRYHVGRGASDSVINLERAPRHLGSVAHSTAANLLALADTNDVLHVWNALTGQKLTELKAASFVRLTFSPDGAVLAGISLTPTDLLREAPKTGLLVTVHFWDIREQRWLSITPGHIAANGFAFHNGTFAIAGANSRVLHIWSVQTGELIGTLSGHRQGVFGVAYAPDDKVLATGSSDGTVKLWNLASGQETATLRFVEDARTGVDARVRRVLFSPNGNLLVAFSYNNRHFRVFRAASWEEIAAREKERRLE